MSDDAMPQVLTTKATIHCPHGGVGTTIAATPYVTDAAAAGDVTCEGDAGTLSCEFIVPCTGYVLASMGLNASSIAGRRLILATDFQKSLTGLPLSIAETTVIVDDSTPAPLPPGASSTPLAPELLDVTPPVVVAAPESVAFTVSVMQPATAMIVFTLTSAFPLSWTLTLLNTSQGKSVDATNGLPSGLVVSPAGGSWPSTTLAVTATLSAAFMASLGPSPGVAPHELYMTGVSKRGKSAHARVLITVS